MSNPEFMIVIPVHNGANYIESTLKSVLSQTYSHFKVIILDNASEDKTVEIIQFFTDTRIHIIPAERPLSIEDNWARILGLDIQDYLVLLCHDDCLYEEFLSEIARLILEYPDASLYHTYFHFTDSKGNVIGKCQPAPFRETGDEFLQNAHRYQEDYLGSGYVMRFSDFKSVGGYPQYPHLIVADLTCYYRLTYLSYKVCSPRYLYQFRRHEKSVGHQTRTMEFLKAVQLYLKDLAQTPYFASVENRELAYQYMIEVFVRASYRKLIYHTIELHTDRQLQMEECQRVKNALTEAQKQEPCFTVRNLPTKCYEIINRIPCWLLRKLIFRLVSPVLELGRSIVKNCLPRPVEVSAISRKRR